MALQGLARRATGWLRWWGSARPLQARGRGRERGGERGAVMRLLPWGISGLFHGGLIVMTLFVVWTTIHEPSGTIVPNVLLGQAPAHAVKLTRESVTAWKQPTWKQTAARKRSSRRQTPSSNAMVSRSPVTSDIIGLTGRAGVEAGATPFGIDSPDTDQLTTSFFGAKGSAHRIVFVVDASGSLIDTLPFVLAQLQQTIEHLSSAQLFTVIFFRGANIYPHHAVVEVPPTGLKQATPLVRQRVADWLAPRAEHIEPGGETNPLQAIALAMSYRPQLLYLLSDNITGSGEYQVDQKRLLAQIKRANTAGVKINTIQFLYPDPLNTIPGRAGTMKLIAQQSGGRYKFVTAKELDLR